MNHSSFDIKGELVEVPMQRFDQAVKWSFGMNVGRLTATLGTSFVLAGLLGPSQFGTVALALIFISLLQLVMQQGLVPAVVQRAGLTYRHLDSAFWMTMSASVAMAVVSIVLSGWWAALNGTPAARDVIRALSVLIVVKGLVVVQEALLRRSMRFKDLAVRTTAASIAGAVVGLTWAFVTPSIWALVAQQVTTEVVGGAVLWSVSGWRPRFRFWSAEARQLLPFAGKASLSSFGVFVNNRVDALLVGIFFGPAAVGIYRLGSRLVEAAIELTIQPVQHVSLPEFSRYQHDPQAAAARYRSLVVLSTAVGGTVLASVFATAQPLLAAVGDEWRPGTVALQLLCVVGLVRVMSMLNGPAVQAAGYPGLQAAMTWIAAGLSAGGFFVAGVLLKDRDVEPQVVGMAASRAALYALVLLPLGQVWLIGRAVGVPGGEYARLVARPLLVSVVAAGVGAVLSHAIDGAGAPPAVTLVAVGSVTAVGCAAGMLGLVRPVRELATSAARTFRSR